MGVGRQFRMVGHLLDQGDSSMRNKHHEVGLIASSELIRVKLNYWNKSVWGR